MIPGTYMVAGGGLTPGRGGGDSRLSDGLFDASIAATLVTLAKETLDFASQEEHK
jgi:hypothetical protein